MSPEPLSPKRIPANFQDHQKKVHYPTFKRSKTEGRKFFIETVEPLFQQSCSSCHTLPENMPDMLGPMTIYDYDALKVYVLNSPSRSNHALMKKVQGIISHAGGNRCPTGKAHPICEVLAAWWDAEYPEGSKSDDPDQLPTGQVTSISPTGMVKGWAANPSRPSETLTVEFYLGGEKNEEGIYLGSKVASSSGYNGGHKGNHSFNFPIPPRFSNGEEQTLYVYTSFGAEDFLLKDMPQTFVSYAPSERGKEFYRRNLASALAKKCSGCHSGSYESNFQDLVSPLPGKGGTSLNNKLINMATGEHGKKVHPPGRICKTKASSPCDEIQNWWKEEFD